MLGLRTLKESLKQHDKTPFLPVFNFYERHSISSVEAVSSDEIIDAIKEIDLREDALIKFFFALRELPAKLCGKQVASFNMDNFTLLEQKNNEISFGLMGQFWRMDFGLTPFTTVKEFVGYSDTEIAKLVLRYKVEKEKQSSTYKIVTETYVACPKQHITKFTCYWLVIYLFSGWIRVRTLKRIKYKLKRR